MAYVVVFEYAGGEIEYRAFRSKGEANRLYKLGVALSATGSLVRRYGPRSSEQVAVLAARLFYADANSHDAAVAAVKTGRAKLLFSAQPDSAPSRADAIAVNS